MNSITYFEIQATDLEGTVDFYREVFGWRITQVPGMPVPYWRIETEGISGGLLQRPVPPPPEARGTNAYVCSMEVENFDAVGETILTKGGRVAVPKFAVPGRRWQGYFIDPEGNTFGVLQVDPHAA